MRKTLCKLDGCDKKRYGLMRLCFFHYREKLRLRKEEKNTKRLERKLASKTYQKSQLKTLHAKCWKLMSEWIRRKDADFFGYVSCYTCSKKFPWREVHAGHHFHGKLDFDERNLKPQDPACNTYRGGMLNVYARKLIQENGLSWYEQLERDAAQHPGYSLEDLKKIHVELTAKLERLSNP